MQNRIVMRKPMVLEQKSKGQEIGAGYVYYNLPSEIA